MISHDGEAKSPRSVDTGRSTNISLDTGRSTSTTDSMTARSCVTTARSVKDEDEIPFLSDHIERFGAGLAQVRAICCGAGAYFGEGCMLMLFSSIAATVAKEWHLSPAQRGFILTMMFLGILIGNFTSGFLAENFGRRKAILVGMIGLFVFLGLSAMSTGYGMLLVCVLLAGLSFGCGQPSWNALGAETTPAKWRVVTASLATFLYSFGGAYTCVVLMIDDPSMHKLTWRWLLYMGAAPSAAFAVLGILFLNESPYWLAAKGRMEEAKAVLESMRRDNFRPDDGPLDFRASQVAMTKSARKSQEGFAKPMRIVFGPQLFWQTLIVMYSCFTFNFIYVGGLYGFAQILPSSDSAGNAALELLIGGLWELPGMFIALAPLPRKTMMRSYAVVAACCFILFNVGNLFHIRAIMQIGFYGVKCSGTVGGIIVYQYATEIYPTDARAMGTAINISGGRIGGIIAPLVYEWVLSLSGSTAVFFYLTAAALVLNFFLVFLLKYETANKPLKEFLTPRVDEDALLQPPPLSVR